MPLDAEVLREVLAQLRGLHEPALPWWPPAPGWWLIVALLAAVGLLLLLRRRVRRLSLRRALRRELRDVERQFAQHRDTRRLAADLGALVRRVAVAREGRAVAGLSGRAWADYLSRHAPDECSAATWEALALRRYDPRFAVADPFELLEDCRRWLERRAS